jgi:acrylyl-CoA reductase (NADPH)
MMKWVYYFFAMDNEFLALWATSPNNDPNEYSQIQLELRPTRIRELSDGDVVIKGEYSGVNYKDALALTGHGKILRQLPLIPGIDVAGRVVSSRSPLFHEGDLVLVNGANLGEKLCGGFSQYLRLPSDVLIPLPPGLSSREAMILGTAGFTAALAIHQMEKNGLRPAKGPVLVTGATGGVGACALSLLNQMGYEAEALTRRQEHQEWLQLSGANKVLDISDFSTRPLESVVWAGAIDNVGGKILEYILPRIDLWGSVASVGLAQSAKLNTTVFPFILRGVNILGVSSNNCPQPLRQELWQRLGSDMKPRNLEHILLDEISLKDLPSFAKKVIAGQHLGRTIVRLNDSVSL